MTTTENNETIDEAVSAPQDGDQQAGAPGAAEPTNEAQADAEQGKAGREAARYRRQLRETEAERDQLLEQVQALHRQALTAAARDITVTVTGERGNPVTRRLEPTGIDDALEAVDTDGLITSEGTVNTELLNERLAALHHEKPHYFQQPNRLHLPSEGKQPRMKNSNTDFASAFAPKSR